MIQLIAGNVDQALTMVVQWARHLTLPKYPPQDTQMDMVKCLLQVRKTHIQWLSKPLNNLKYSQEDKKLI